MIPELKLEHELVIPNTKPSINVAKHPFDFNFRLAALFSNFLFNAVVRIGPQVMNTRNEGEQSRRA